MGENCDGCSVMYLGEMRVKQSSELEVRSQRPSEEHTLRG